MAADRLHYLDNLRALAMLAGVLFHAGLAYSPLLQPLFPTADRENAEAVDAVLWLLHLFRMPLFFVIAGYFAARLVQERGMVGLFRNRLLRIALPFVVCWPLLHASLMALTLHAAATAQHPSPMLAYLRTLLQSGQPLPQMPPSTGHLWFLYYLMLFYVLVWVARSLELGTLAARLRALSPASTMLVLPLGMVPALASVSAPHPAPESVLPQFWALGYYGPFFAWGYLRHGEPSIAGDLRRYAPWLVAASLALYAAWWLALARAPDPVTATASWPVALLQACISVWMTTACLIYGQRLLDRRDRLLRPLADASYWTYVVHLPILFAIQYQLMDLALPWWAKFAISALATLALCQLSHRLLVRRTVLGRIFGGQAPRGARGAPVARHGWARGPRSADRQGAAAGSSGRDTRV